MNNKKCYICGNLITNNNYKIAICDSCKRIVENVVIKKNCSICYWKGIEEDTCFNCNNFDKWKLKG